jgi:hypothetical protein
MTEYRLETNRPQVPVGLLVAMVAGFAGWLLLVWYATASTLARTNHEELVVVATWGVAIVVGGLFLVYTWTVMAAIIERERLRSTLARSLLLADQALEEAQGKRGEDATHA